MAPKVVVVIRPGKPPESFRYDEGEVPPLIVPNDADTEQDTSPPEPEQKPN